MGGIILSDRLFTVPGVIVIVVSGVLLSNYIASPAPFLEHLSFDTQHWMQHDAFPLYRVFSRLVGGSKAETYDKMVSPRLQ